MKTLLKWFNDNHWYVIAAVIIVSMCLWTYGCESQVASLIDPAKKVNRMELQVELEYVAGIAKTRVADLDKQDAIKQALFDALTTVSQGGQINAMGLLNLAGTIGAISWGLKKNQALAAANKQISTNSA